MVDVWEPADINGVAEVLEPARSLGGWFEVVEEFFLWEGRGGRLWSVRLGGGRGLSMGMVGRSARVVEGVVVCERWGMRERCAGSDGGEGSPRSKRSLCSEGGFGFEWLVVG